MLVRITYASRRGREGMQDVASCVGVDGKGSEGRPGGGGM